MFDEGFLLIARPVSFAVIVIFASVLLFLFSKKEKVEEKTREPEGGKYE